MQCTALNKYSIYHYINIKFLCLRIDKIFYIFKSEMMNINNYSHIAVKYLAFFSEALESYKVFHHTCLKPSSLVSVDLRSSRWK